MENTMTNATAPVENTQLAKSDGGQMIASSGDPMIDMLERAIINPNVDADKLSKVIELANAQEDRARKIQLEDDERRARRIFQDAFVAAKERMPQIVKDAYNEQTSSNYAAMEKVDAAITPIMSEHGFAITFKSGDNPISDDHMHGIAILIHKDGHEEKYEDRRIPIVGVGAKGTRMMTHTHGYGATKTYARRYMTFDIWGLTAMSKDSDGNVNNALSDEAKEICKQIDAAQTVPDLDLVHATIQSASLASHDRQEVISVFSIRRKALLNKEAQNAGS